MGQTNLRRHQGHLTPIKSSFRRIVGSAGVPLQACPAVLILTDGLLVLSRRGVGSVAVEFKLEGRRVPLLACTAVLLPLLERRGPSRANENWRDALYRVRRHLFSFSGKQQTATTEHGPQAPCSRPRTVRANTAKVFSICTAWL